MRNVELFDKIAKAIEDEPDRYDQAVYGGGGSCGTAHCVAGWAAALEGCTPKMDTWCTVVLPDGTVDKIDSFAQKRLGLDEMDAEALFAAGWRPETRSVPDELRAIGRGAEIEFCYDDDDDPYWGEEN